MTGLEPARIAPPEPNDTAMLLKHTFFYLTKPIIARISAVVKWLFENI